MSKHWAPKPMMDRDPNGLFQVDESVEVVNKGLTPIQRQRRIDGTPHTVTGATALRPEGPKLHLDDLSKGYSLNAPDKDGKEDCDPDEVMKAYLAKKD